MALQKCPECRHKISEFAPSCPHCGFSFDPQDLALYRQKLEQKRLNNEQLNRQNTKIQLFWLLLFLLVIGIAILLNN